MVRPSERRIPPAQPTGFVCRRVEDWPTLQQFNDVFARANELPPTGFWLSRGLLGLSSLDLVVGYLDGEPVATGAGSTAASLAGIWATATLPACRGKGVGTAVTRSVIDAGERSGARVAHLWATEMGYPVYRKMGFRHVQNMACWTGAAPDWS